MISTENYIICFGLQNPLQLEGQGDYGVKKGINVILVLDRLVLITTILLQ